MLRPFRTALLLAGTLFVAGPAFAADEMHADTHDHAHAAAKPAVTPYVLPTCPVSGDELGKPEEGARTVHEGREVRFCCQDCLKDFKADPAKYTAKIDKQLADTQRPFYAMQTCPVSGEKLGGMGEPAELVYDNHLVRFCCEGCAGDFKKDPAKYLAKLDQAVIDQQVGSYPLKTCVVSGDELGKMGEPEDVVIAGRLVRLCCNGCKKDLAKDPAGYLAKVNAAWGATAKPAAEKPAEHTGHDHAGKDEHAGHNH